MRRPSRGALHAIVNHGLAVGFYPQDLVLSGEGQDPCPGTEQVIQVWGDLVSAGLASAHCVLTVSIF